MQVGDQYKNKENDRICVIVDIINDNITYFYFGSSDKEIIENKNEFLKKHYVYRDEFFISDNLY